MSDEMDEIWVLYADDGAQALDAMETALMALGNGGRADAGDHVGALFRAVHTFKGNSRVLGLSVVESRAHLSEDLIGLVRDSGVPWDAEIKDILLLAADTLRAMLEETAATRADVDPAPSEDLMRRLADKIARASGAEPAAAAPEPEPAPRPVAAAPAVAEPATTEPATTEPDPTPAPKKRARKSDPAPEPETAPASEPAAPPAKRLADDPAYRDIFRGMASDAVKNLTAALTAFDEDAAASLTRARKDSDTLRHAATQMGLDDWSAALSDYLSAADTGAQPLAALLDALATLSDATFGPANPAAAAISATFGKRCCARNNCLAVTIKAVRRANLSCSVMALCFILSLLT